MRHLLLISALLLPAALPAHAKDMQDRALGLELNRDRSESRIERLHEDKQREDRARAEAVKKQPVKKSPRPKAPAPH
jgi:hypothetical protein